MTSELSRRYKQTKLSPEQRKEVNRIWHQDKQRHADFFAGLTPQQEYDLHTKRRKEMNDE